MPKRKRPAAQPNRVRGLTSFTRESDGVTIYRWVPTPKDRRNGFTETIKLGDDLVAARTQAEHWNQRAAAAALPVPVATAPRRLPRRMTLGDAIHEYSFAMNERGALPAGHDDHLTKKTLRQYRLLLGWLDRWGGTTFLDEIDVQVCKDLRLLLVNGTSDWNTAARLRMLRQLLGYAASTSRRWIRENPMDSDEITIPTPKSRTKRAAIEAVEWLATFARSFVGDDKLGITRYGGPNLELAVLLGFFTTQREADQLAATRMNWRPIEDIDDFDRATLSLGGNGAVYGLRIFQQKTRKWVTCFLPHDVAAKLDALIESRGAGWDGPLLQNDAPGALPRHMHEQEFQRIYRAMRDAAVERARADGDDWLADQLAGLQYRDMRRSGMCWMRDMGVQVPQIASISGHKIEYTMKILDTYMPGDPRASAAGLASAIRTRDSRKAKEKTG